MFDLHYDLLTNILIRQNDIKSVKKYCHNIYRSDNIIGGIFNLFYMSPNEMKKELKIKYEDINIIENLKKVNKLIKEYNIIPNGIKYIYGIEGLDYLQQIDDIDILYDLGVRSVNIVWNNENKFGSRNKRANDKRIN
jgi:microsomal dipeptidase-like Zn-dependent dipeptidase